jgi:DNA-binding GntR family transcriptional regulator
MAAQSSPSPIPRVTLASMVGDRIRADVVEGVLPPGSQLNEVELATTFGVSRGPVREALQRLIQEGLLLREPHRGVFVPVMTPEDVDDIYLVREAMETTAVRRLAGLSRTASASKALDRIVRAMETAERADDWNTVASRDLDFHSALVAAADSPRLERMFTTVISETRLCLGVLSAAYDTRDDLVEEHRRISDLIRQNDVDGAVAALKKHFDDGVVTLKRRLASRGGPQAG